MDIESTMAGEVETSKPRASIGVGESAGNFSNENISRPGSDTTNHPTNASAGRLGWTYLDHCQAGWPSPSSSSRTFATYHGILITGNTSPTPPTHPHTSSASPTPITRPQRLECVPVASNVSPPSIRPPSAYNTSPLPPTYPARPQCLQCLYCIQNASNA
ncbi:hypothetical protein OG21DRAFT_936405 [Imleria badia]|nr:hypothetical protein OG21DRAFT_936405 [Imleria badia]